MTSLTLRTNEDRLYWATLIDVTTRMVTGWQLVPTCAPALVTAALAITHDHIARGAVFYNHRGPSTPRPTSLVLHSQQHPRQRGQDRGVLAQRRRVLLRGSKSEGPATGRHFRPDLRQVPRRGCPTCPGMRLRSSPTSAIG